MEVNNEVRLPSPPFGSLPRASDGRGLCKRGVNTHRQAMREGTAILLT